MSRAVRLDVLACAFVLASAATATSVAFAQQPPPPPDAQQPVFRAGTTFVSVDVYPRRDGALIEGLTAADFEVFEDGQPQQVESFQFIRVEPNAPDAERRDPNTKTDGDRQAADPRNRVFVVYLDLANTTIAGSHYARQPVLDFLNRTIGPGDLFGVMTAEVPMSQLVFGRRTETLENELVRYWPWGQADRMTQDVRNAYEQRLAECGLDAVIPLSRHDQLMTNLEQLMLRLGDLRDERKNVLFISEGWVPRGPRTDLLNRSISQGAVPTVGIGPGGRMGLGDTLQPFGQDVTWCDSELHRLASIDFELRFRQLLTSAVRANVSFYPVDVGGLRTSATGGTETLRTLAENTDGFAIVSTNDLVGGVRRIEHDLSAFYLLGYYSTNTAANGRFREIEVKVKQPDVRVSARRGYMAPTAALAAAAAAPSPARAPSAIDDALATLATSRDGADLFVGATATRDGIRVAVELAAGVATRDAWRQGASIRAVATSGDATATATAELAAGSRHAELTIPRPDNGTGTWQVVVQAMGTGERLEQRDETEIGAARFTGPPLAWRGTSSPRVPLRPLADARLRRGERLHVEWPVIAPAESMVVRLLDRTGRALGEPLPQSTPAAGQPPAVIVDLPIGALPEGDFLLSLEATQAGETERQLLAFRVTR